MKKLFVLGCAAVVALAAINAHAQDAGGASNLIQKPAARLQAPLKARMLGAARAGARIVAVGDRGAVLLSDDDGKSYRQARAVPTRATLTSVAFADDKQGWAVGHWGVILHTQDGGDTWTLQRDDLNVDQPLFSVWFKDRNHGIAVGLFSLVLKTDDGGKTWNAMSLPPPPGAKKSDVNLFRVFADRGGNVFIAGEQGLVFSSGDGGSAWEAIRSGNKGTFWAGVVLDDSATLAAGLRGKIYRSTDHGKTWDSIDSGTHSSITDLAQLPDGRVLAIGLDGVTLTSDDRGHSFKVQQRADQRALTALAVAGSGAVVFSESGVVKD